jgi:hypothetical protein
VVLVRVEGGQRLEQAEDGGLSGVVALDLSGLADGGQVQAAHAVAQGGQVGADDALSGDLVACLCCAKHCALVVAFREGLGASGPE